MDKRGLSSVIATVLLVLLSIVAIAIVWNVFYFLILDAGEDINLDSVVGRISLEKVEIVDGFRANVLVKRTSGEGEIPKIKIVFTNENGDSQVVTEEFGSGELETKRYEVDLELQPTKVEVVPIFLSESGEEKAGKVSASKTNFVFKGEDMVAYYTFDGDASDYSGNGNNGVKHGNVEFVDGKKSKAAKFEGNTVDDYIIINPFNGFPEENITITMWVKIPTSVPTDKNVSLFSITITMWVKIPTSVPTDKNVSLFSYASSYHCNNFLITRPNNIMVVKDGGRSCPGENCTILSGNLIDDKWHFLAVSWRKSDGRLRYWIDGDGNDADPIGEGNYLAPDGSLVFGQEQDRVGGDFEINQAYSGLIDDVRIYKRTLTDEKIGVLMSV